MVDHHLLFFFSGEIPKTDGIRNHFRAERLKAGQAAGAGEYAAAGDANG